MEAELKAELRDDSKCSPSDLKTWPEWRDQRCALVLVPAYVITYRHRKDEYQGIVNGWTGEAAALRRRDVLSEIIVVAILLAIVAGVIYGVVRLLS